MSRIPRARQILPVGILFFVLGCGTAGIAETPESDAVVAGSDPAPDVAEQAPPADAPRWKGSARESSGAGLDQLLTLPVDRTYTVDRRGGMTQGEWRARFAAIRDDIGEEQAALEAAEQRMDAAAEGGQWQVAPPIPGQTGAAPGETTLDFKTRQEIRRHRSEIERLERRLREVEIEANLAAVPDEWR